MTNELCLIADEIISSKLTDHLPFKYRTLPTKKLQDTAVCLGRFFIKPVLDHGRAFKYYEICFRPEGEINNHLEPLFQVDHQEIALAIVNFLETIQELVGTNDVAALDALQEEEDKAWALWNDQVNHLLPTKHSTTEH